MDDLWQQLRGLDAASLADAGLRVLPAEIRALTPGVRLFGRVLTVDSRDDLMPVLGGLRQGGPGDVLMVATGGARLAMAGELFATEALRRGMAGLVIGRYCRGLATLRRLPPPGFAPGAAPRAAPAPA